MSSFFLRGYILTACAFLMAVLPHASAEDQYLNYAQVVQVLDDLENNNREFAKVIDMAPQTQPKAPNARTTIKAIQITKGANGHADPNKKSVILVGAAHPKEWIGGAVALAVAKYLIDNRANAHLQIQGINHDIDMPMLLRNCEIVIVPILNPDGYNYSLAHPDDYWRTNLRDLAGIQKKLFAANDDYTGAKKDEVQTEATPANPEPKLGVDLFRNGRFKWHPAVRAYDDPAKNYVNFVCYRGDEPGSEQEIKALENLFAAFPKARATIFYHSAGGSVMYPWGYIRQDVPAANKFLVPTEKDSDKLKELANKMADLSNYVACRSSGPGGPGGYVVSGGLDDWAYAEKHAASFTVETYKNEEEYNPPTQQGKEAVEKENVKSTMFLIGWAASDVPQGAPVPKR